jgi:hypothetical protein
MMLGIPLWSFGLSYIWKADVLSTTVLVAYGAFVGNRFVMYRTVSADKQSCRFYSVSRKFTWGNTEKLTMEHRCGTLSVTYFPVIGATFMGLKL